MARIKNTIPRVKRRRVAFPLMLISLGIVVFIALYFLDYKSQGLGMFKTRLDQVIEKFENVEKMYNDLITVILTKRSPTPEFTVDVVEESYTEILSDVSEIEKTFSNPTRIESLRSIILTRLSTLQTIRDMNQTLRAEDLIGNSLGAYTTCKKNISFRQKASQIISKLSQCQLELNTATSSLADFPKASTAHCALRYTPSYYLQKTLKSHELLVSSYTYSTIGKAKEAASQEIEYQKTILELQQLPAWNSCISTYLQKAADELLGKVEE